MRTDSRCGCGIPSIRREQYPQRTQPRSGYARLVAFGPRPSFRLAVWNQLPVLALWFTLSMLVLS